MKYLILIVLLWSFSSWGKNPLLEMTEEPSIEQLKKWIEDGVNVNEQTAEGLTPLIISAQNKWHHTVQILMDNKVHVNSVDRDGNTALHYTAYNNDLETAQIILIHQQATHQKEHSLTERMIRGISKRFESDYVKINAYNKEHKTPFMIAVQKGFLKYAQLLKSFNANIEAQDLEKQTSLFYAVNNKDLKMVQYLIEQKADVKAKDKNNNMPIHLAVHLRLYSIVNALAVEGHSPLNTPSFNNMPPLHESIMALDARMTQILLQAGANPNNTHTGESENIPPLGLLFILSNVSENKMLEITKFFISSKKTDINAITHSPIEKNTYLHIAIDKNYEELTDLLLKKKGIKLNVFNAKGRSPLLLAIEQKKLQMVQKLLSAGANPNQKPSDVFHLSPLQVAVNVGSIEIINALITAQADTTIIDLNGNTLLHRVFDRSFVPVTYFIDNSTIAQITQILIASKVDPNISNNEKYTPAMKAVLSNNFQALEVLVNNDADLTLTDHRGRTAYDHLEKIKQLSSGWDTSKVEKILSDANGSMCEKKFSDPA